MGEEAAIVAKRQADKAAGVAAIRAFRNDAAAWPGRFCEKQALVETTVKVLPRTTRRSAAQHSTEQHSTA